MAKLRADITTEDDMKYFWPLLFGGIFQLSWNFVLMMPCHGKFNSGFCNWVYGRYCDYGFCGGTVVLAVVWALVAIATVVNATFQIRRSR